MEGREGGLKGWGGVQMSEHRVIIVHALYRLYQCTDVKERPIG